MIHSHSALLEGVQRWQGIYWTDWYRGLVFLCNVGEVGAILQDLPFWQAREAEFEAEQERMRREKEKEIARLRATQEKAQDYQAEQVST